ncbi:C4-dicarboxylate ABC transporter [Brevundimonas sp. AAP58]|nr:C4-dicarboxylate ABC transporter [Brevundimonas sp. AAP58]
MIGLLILVVLAAFLSALAWMNRRAAAREALVSWLDQRGIPAEVEVERVELDGFVGRVRIGDAADPDVTIQRVEVDYALVMPWASGGMGVTPSRIRLVRPVMRATWRDGELSFGSLDPLIEEFTGRPPRPDQRGPVVIIETGRLRLDTEYGPISVLADASIDDGKLMRMAARMPTASLRSGDIDVRSLGGTLDLTTTGDRVAVRLGLDADKAEAPGLQGQGLDLALTGTLPYPDMQARRGDGRADIDLRLSGDRLALGQTVADDAVLTLSTQGQATGWINTLGFDGAATARLTATRLTTPAATAASTDITLAEGRIAATRVDGGQVSIAGPIRTRMARVASGDLVLSDVTGRQTLDYASESATPLTLTGSLAAARGTWPLFGAVARDDGPELAELKRALGAFSLSAPSLRLTSNSDGVRVALTQPARISPANGGVLTLSPVARPIFEARPGQSGGGALTLTATRGGGLPEAAFAIPDWRLTPGGFQARIDGLARLDFTPARGVAIRTAGLLASDNGRVTYAPSDCLGVTADRLDLDENDIVSISGRLCPTAAPLLVAQGGGWRVTGDLRDVAAQAPFLALAFSDASGNLIATGSSAGLGLDARIDTATINDATVPLRFNTLIAQGRAGLANAQWSGTFDLARFGHPLGRLTLAHDGITGRGGVSIDAPDLTFAEGGLQPADLSPLAADFVQSPATGSAAFTGRIDWSPDLTEGGSSSGRLVIPNIDFVSPAGPVKGLTGTIDFTNLAPLTTAPGQTLRVATLESIAPFTDLDLTFALDKAAITVDGGAIQAAGGLVRIEPFSVPLDRRPFSGVIVLERVQLGELIAGSGFGDKVALDAIVSGRLPFTYDPDSGVRITGGRLAADQPGRLSIQREALTGLQAGGGGAVPPGTVEDLAYQAMENLAFDILSADVNSLDEGRIGVLFRIVGRHDPPERQEIRLSLAEFISREFLNRPLPLPSNTGIDLTLDTTLNVNQLVSDLLEVNRARNGDQP